MGSVTNHNAPIYKPHEGNAAYNIHASISQLIEIYKVPSDKITLGLAFYGRSVTMNNNDGLHSRSNGLADALTFPEEKGTPSYYNIVSKSKLFNRNWDESAQVPYLTGKNGLLSFVSFDDPESITLKAIYALENNLKGVVIWDISGDYIETFPGSGLISETPLCDAIKKAFCDSQFLVKHANDDNDPGLMAFPNPFRSEIEISWNSEFIASELKVVNGAGQVVFQTFSNLFGDLKLNTSEWTPGIYFISLTAPGKANLVKVLKL
ncbi:MAG: T9SS type A sorting domain-containing protein [Bacteroidetes bacterium]|nr:T9SS type A sorting domain-containing protein [Bacteroidota bacterium]